MFTISIVSVSFMPDISTLMTSEENMKPSTTIFTTDLIFISCLIFMLYHNYSMTVILCHGCNFMSCQTPTYLGRPVKDPWQGPLILLVQYCWLSLNIHPKTKKLSTKYLGMYICTKHFNIDICTKNWEMTIGTNYL